ncbi:MAG TPA: sigma factor, partial [Ktedonobacteraceae bacterium]|nr:sigma factor [Ktedonobacteraceae bacterium]
MTRDDSIAIPEREAIHREPECVIQKSSPRLSINRVEEALASARPRLLRLATVRGVAPDAIDDVVQETLLEAWQYLDRLRSPEHFDAWLDGICRNICRRWQ